MLFSSAEIDFVLRNAGGPEQTDDFDVLLRTETGEDRRGILSEVARSALHFPLLVQRPGVQLDFCADGVFVVVEGFQIETNPIVLVATFIAEQKRWSAQLRDN